MSNKSGTNLTFDSGKSSAYQKLRAYHSQNWKGRCFMWIEVKQNLSGRSHQYIFSSTNWQHKMFPKRVLIFWRMSLKNTKGSFCQFFWKSFKQPSIPTLGITRCYFLLKKLAWIGPPNLCANFYGKGEGRLESISWEGLKSFNCPKFVLWEKFFSGKYLKVDVIAAQLSDRLSRFCEKILLQGICSPLCSPQKQQKPDEIQISNVFKYQMFKFLTKSFQRRVAKHESHKN